MKNQTQFRRVEEILIQNFSNFPDKSVAKCLYMDNTWREFTWGRLYEEAHLFANKLKAAGCKEGDRIGILAENSLEWMVAFFGIWICGATAVLFDPKLMAEQLDKQVLFVDLRALLIAEHLYIKLSKAVFDQTLVFKIDSFEKVTDRVWVSDAIDREKDPEIAVIIFTSGTTGTYRAVMLTHENLLATVNFSDQNLSSFLVILPWNHIFGLTAGLLIPIYRGCVVLVIQKPDWNTLSKAMQQEHPGGMPAVPRILNLIHGQILNKINQQPKWKQKVVKSLMALNAYLRKKWNLNLGFYFFPFLHKTFGSQFKFFFSGGASLSLQVLDDLQALGFTVLEGYGLTESAGIASINSPKSLSPGSVGHPASNVQFHIAFPDAKGNGEICLKGPNIMQGYFRDPQSTENALVEGWYRTGDRGYIDREGNIVITGRIKELIVISTGKKVSPEEIEDLYSLIPGVKELAVVGFSKEQGSNDEIYAALVLEDGSQLTLEQQQNAHRQVMENFLERSKKLPVHMQIQSFVFLDELPRTTTLKVKRKELLKMIMKKAAGDAAMVSEKNVSPSSNSTSEEEVILKEVIGKLKTILSSQTEITPSKHLSELGVDSLSALFLINNLNERYGDFLTSEHIFSNPTVNELVQYIARGPQQQSAAPPEQQSSNQEVSKISSKEEMKSQLTTDHIFLTGVTGVLGGYLVRTLLEETSAHLYCLIRSDTELNAQKRLLAFLETYETSQSTINQMKERVHLILGDVTQDKFGLSDRDYAQLIEKIDLTIHAAASISLHGAYEPLIEVNINGTARIIDFAMQTKQKYLAYISTYTVMGDRHLHACEPFSERDLEVGQGFYGMGYQRTKYEAEKLIHAAGEKGLQWMILRPGDIFGDSKTGCYPLKITNVQSLFYDLLKTVIETQCAANSALYFDMVPVDYVAKAIAYLCTKKKEIFAVYHLTNPKPHHYFEIIEILKHCGYEIEIVSAEDYISRLKLHALHNVEGKEYHSMTTELFTLNHQLIREQGSSYVNCNYTKEVLKAAGIVCPQIDERLLKTYIQYCERQGYISVPNFAKKL